MSAADARRGALDAIERMLNRGDEADEVLRRTVEVLRERVGYSWVGISFVEEDRLVLGPSAGESPPGGPPTLLPIRYDGRAVAELAVSVGEKSLVGEADLVFLERVATLVSAHCVVAWDTGGAAWEA